MLSAVNPSYILGYHGCDREIAEFVLAGKGDLLASANTYDWLGHGIYFWEDNPARAEEWAEQRMSMPGSTIKDPYVIGAVIDLGFCFSLMRSDHLDTLKNTYGALKELADKFDKNLPTNAGGKDKFLRHLDCAVIQALHKVRERSEKTPIDSLRGIFQEGEEIYPGSSFRERNHIQVCIRDRSCIKGYFRPIIR